jgi:hypothetical protein
MRYPSLKLIVSEGAYGSIFSTSKIRNTMYIGEGAYDVLSMDIGCKDEITTTIKMFDFGNASINRRIITRTHNGLTPIGKSQFNLDGLYNMVHDYCYKYTIPWHKKRIQELKARGEQEEFFEYVHPNDLRFRNKELFKPDVKFNMEITE